MSDGGDVEVGRLNRLATRFMVAGICFAATLALLDVFVFERDLVGAALGWLTLGSLVAASSAMLGLGLWAGVRADRLRPPATNGFGWGWPPQ